MYSFNILYIIIATTIFEIIVLNLHRTHLLHRTSMVVKTLREHSVMAIMISMEFFILSSNTLI